MLVHGILNPQINSLISRVRHTNLLVIADRGFPFWPMIETVDISLADDIPTVLQVLNAIRPNFSIDRVVMAKEFFKANDPAVCDSFKRNLQGLTTVYETHRDLKKRVPQAIGLIRTGDTVQYANMILISG
jgi:D-ribose pyranase